MSLGLLMLATVAGALGGYILRIRQEKGKLQPLHKGQDAPRINNATPNKTMLVHMNAVTNPSPTSKASFQVNGFGGAKLVRAKEMYQFGIIPVDQGVYF